MRLAEVKAKNSWYVGSAPTPRYAIKGAMMQNPYREQDVPYNTLVQDPDGTWRHTLSGKKFKVVKSTSKEPSEGWAYNVYEL